MKRINLILCFILMNVAIWAQKVDGAGNNIDPYVGTWVYQSNDTIFKIVRPCSQKCRFSMIAATDKSV